MNNIISGDAKFPVSSDCLLPANLYMGVAGWLRLSGTPQQTSISMEAHQNEETITCVAANFAISIRGQKDYFVSSEGWHVFVLGAAACAQRVASILDRAVMSSDACMSPRLTRTDEAELCWALLPTAGIVAIHPASGTLCLLRDGCGFVPIYFSVHADTIYFSTNLPFVRAHVPYQGINTDKINEMLVFGHRSGRRTIWQNILTLIPGEMVIVNSSRRIKQHSFWTFEAMFDPAERRRLEKSPVTATLTEIRQTLDISLTPMHGLARIGIPCGGGVDSSLLGAYISAKEKKRGTRTTYWCINQPDAPRKESDWTQSLSQAVGIPCIYSDLTRESFLRTLLSTLSCIQQPFTGPNAVGGNLLRQKAKADGEEWFISGELCDTMFGGLSGFKQMSPAFRLLRRLASLPPKIRARLTRGLLDEDVCLFGSTLVMQEPNLSRLGFGDLERVEGLQEAQSIRYAGQSAMQQTADMLTWMQFKSIMGTLHTAFFENVELFGIKHHYPFAYPGFIKLGLHLPHFLKRNKGCNKWLWRVFASQYIGREIAFRPKYSFPTLTSQWLDRADALLQDGFLANLLCAPVSDLRSQLDVAHPARWTLINLELWGRIHCQGEKFDSIFAKLI